MKNDSRLVIFDCDGVLVDSEPLSNAIFAAMVNDLGLKISLEESAERFTGRSLTSCLTDVEQTLGIELPDSFKDDFTNATFEAFRQDLTPVRGIRDLLENFPYSTCVASSGDHEKIRTTLGITGLYPFFEGRIFSATEVSRGKPHPDLFLYAAESMGFQPSACIVIEDSVPGVNAALAAGMKVLGYSERTLESKLKDAGAVTFSDMNNLLQLVVSSFAGSL